MELLFKSSFIEPPPCVASVDVSAWGHGSLPFTASRSTSGGEMEQGCGAYPADEATEEGLGGVGPFLEDGEAAGERGLGG